MSVGTHRVRLLITVILCFAAGAYAAGKGFKTVLTTKVRESRWGNGIFELAFVGVGCRVTVVDMHVALSVDRMPSPANLADGVIATSEILCDNNASEDSNAISSLGVGLSGNSLLAASSNSEYLLALELIYEGKEEGKLFVTNLKRLNGQITRISDAVYDDSLGSEVYYVTTSDPESGTGSVLCIRNSRTSLDILSTGIVGTANVRDVSPIGHNVGSVFVSWASGMMKFERQGQNMTTVAQMKSPGDGNDGFALASDKYAFVASRGDGLRIFDLSNGSLLVTQPLPKESGWAGGVAVKDMASADSKVTKFLAVVAADAGIFGYQLAVDRTESLQLNLQFSLKLGDGCGSEQGCGWNIAMGSRKCKVYVSDKGMGLYVVDICLSVPVVVGTLQL